MTVGTHTTMNEEKHSVLVLHSSQNAHEFHFIHFTGSKDQVNIQNWPTAFARPVGLACHRVTGSVCHWWIMSWHDVDADGAAAGGGSGDMR